MTYIIAEPCIDIKDRSCVDVCPVDCIHEADRILVIDPEECIDCGACEPECPVEAIFPEDALPDKWEPFVKINYAYSDGMDAVNQLTQKYADEQQRAEPTARVGAANRERAPREHAAGRGCRAGGTTIGREIVMEQEMLHEQAAGYALDILDEDERSAFERHLETCAQCREEILHRCARPRASSRLGVPRSRPPARAPGPPARERARRAAERRARCAAGRRPRSRLAVRARGGRGRGGRDRARDLGREPVELALEGARRPSAPRSRRSPSSPARPRSTSPLRGVERIARRRRRTAAPRSRSRSRRRPSGKTYEAWVVQGKSPRPAGLFEGGDGTTAVLLVQARADEQPRRRHGGEGRRRESSHEHAHPDRRAHGLGFVAVGMLGRWSRPRWTTSPSGCPTATRSRTS